MSDKPPPASAATDVEKLRRHVRILVELGRLAGQRWTPERFLDQAVVQVGRAIEIHHVKIMQYRPATADLLMVAGTGWKKGLVRVVTFPSDLRSPPGRAYLTAEPVSIADCSKAPDFVLSDMLKEHGIVSLANVPILTDGAAWGVLEVDSTVPRDFSADTLSFMIAAGAIIGSTLERRTSPGGESAALAEAAAEARRREVLLRELQHRVKNNFQLILASISLQKRRFDPGETHRALDHITNRIHAISLAHDQLSPRQDAQTVDVAGYLRALCASIEQQVENVAIEIEADEIALSIERAMPLGLVVNEAVTNSVKHAFAGRAGHIFVRLQAGVGFGEGRLVVIDDGNGFEKHESSGSGLKLIESLARQIGGQVSIESSRKGTSTSVTFPIIG
ncbi:MAG: GAF domain-containing protein [Reyranella sp.]|uniref:histidine kinase dimerization/phosphoacceptor domain -containing protein n=1 Tax=Reyranella sp. TaxID=1929291 RepID=UPI001211355E|nr:histidine kinase dimerization/phosphoacceptor domain -containing protein [Reyranella sp.]TAJ91735.1 MAG: GAF domain-containing protein [Reyranella sp.]